MQERDHLLEVERLVRDLIDDRNWAHLVGECDSECEETIECNATVTGEVDCPKCGEKVPFEKDCEGKKTCPATCTADVEVDQDEDVLHKIEVLERALVALDLCRNRETRAAPAAAEPVTETRTRGAA